MASVHIKQLYQRHLLAYELVYARNKSIDQITSLTLEQLEGFDVPTFPSVESILIEGGVTGKFIISH